MIWANFKADCAYIHNMFLQGRNRHTSMLEITFRSILVASVVVSVVIYDSPGSTTTPPDNTLKLTQFRFHVHCPITQITDASFTQLMNYLGISDQTTMLNIFTEVSRRTSYAVFVKALASDSSNVGNSSVLMAYCGWTKLKNQSNCSNAKFVCTVPGPMFENPVGQQIDIIWVNEVNGTGLNWTDLDGNCYQNDSDSKRCTVQAKLNQSTFDCTFNKPTDFDYLGVKTVRISPEAVPISPHIHGLEMRPAFDGGSLSWFNNVGDKGPGYQSLSTNTYFNKFSTAPKTFLKGLLSKAQANKIKVVRLPNKQPPGMSFYHDHSMQVTLSNNVRGCAGFYILTDPNAEGTYPKGNQEYIFVFHPHNQGDVRDNSTRRYNGGDILSYVSPIGDSTFLYGNQSVQRNYTYRWKFLNGHYDTIYYNISFAIFYEQLTDSNGFSYLQECAPPLNSPNFTNNMHVLNFTTIGADSTLFDQPIPGLNKFTLGPAERLDTLIKFDSVPDNISKVYIVAFENIDVGAGYVVKAVLCLKSDILPNLYLEPESYSKVDVSYYNLSTAGSQVFRKRMRSLFSRPREQLFTINMHAIFTQAGYQNPTIGSVQDWYIINTVTEPHPIHFHTVNFQMMQQFSLKYIQAGCTLFELDFFRESNITEFQIADDTELCYFLGNLTLDLVNQLIPQFNVYQVENQFLNNISGKNVLQPTQTNGKVAPYVGNCSLGKTYKYVCEETTSQMPKYHQKWKDTALVRGFHVLVLRIRWAKTAFNPNLTGDTYFSYLQMEMIEFPGSLYHCHMLAHEQNRMMRPIALQLSETFLSDQVNDLPTCTYEDWINRYRCINLNLNCSIPASGYNSTNTTFYNMRSRVHCPIPNVTHPAFLQLHNYTNLSNQSTIDLIDSSLKQTETYIIFVRAWSNNYNNNNPELQLLLSYCGWVRWQDEPDCSNSQFVCASPAPIFNLTQGSTVQFIWVNQINSTGLSWRVPYDFDFCYYPQVTDPQCNLDAKNKNISASCTFTDYNMSTSKNDRVVRISGQAAPVSPHYHGMQIRPAFDGGPYSWFNNAGDEGIGFQTLNNVEYFMNFQRKTQFINQSIPEWSSAGVKITKLQITQPPGLLFYHDHSMKATLYNVMKGLVGLLVINNATVQSQYPLVGEQVFVILSYFNNDDIRKYYTQEPDPFRYINPMSNSQNPLGTITLYRNMTYWFRILNGHFDNVLSNISFAIFYNTSTDSNGSLLYNQLPPNLPDQYQNFSQNMYPLNVTVIGSDSALFQTPVKGISAFRLASAQRLDVLVSFNNVPLSISKVYIVCFDNFDNIGYYVVKAIINLRPEQVQNKYSAPEDVTSTSFKFYNMSNISSSSIAVSKMRVIQSRPSDAIFTINLHHDMEKGGASVSQIGTIEDWYMLNMAQEIHPIHVHLINFQIVQRYSLKTVPEGCSLYQLDYFRQTKVAIFQVANNSLLCSLLQNNFTLSDYPYSTTFANYLLEGNITKTPRGLVEGKDVMQTYTLNASTARYNVSSCSLNSVYKYICDDTTTQIEPYLRGWKETVPAWPLQATIIRIRFASVDYNPSVSVYPYFSYGEDQLIQFPGFVYHCHILRHQDNTMMRNFVLRPSDMYLAKLKANGSSSCAKSDWLTMTDCINTKLGC